MRRMRRERSFAIAASDGSFDPKRPLVARERDKCCAAVAVFYGNGRPKSNLLIGEVHWGKLGT